MSEEKDTPAEKQEALKEKLQDMGVMEGGDKPASAHASSHSNKSHSIFKDRWPLIMVAVVAVGIWWLTSDKTSNDDDKQATSTATVYQSGWSQPGQVQSGSGQADGQPTPGYPAQAYAPPPPPAYPDHYRDMPPPPPPMPEYMSPDSTANNQANARPQMPEHMRQRMQQTMPKYMYDQMMEDEARANQMRPPAMTRQEDPYGPPPGWSPYGPPQYYGPPPGWDNYGAPAYGPPPGYYGPSPGYAPGY